jgi:hypothetical protein
MNAGRGQWLSIICTVLTLLFGNAALFAFCLRHLPQKVTLPITLWLFRADDIIIAGGEDPQMGSGLAILSAGIELLALLLIAAAAWKAGQSFMHRASGETASKDSAMFWYFCGWLLVVTLKIGLDNLLLHASIDYSIGGPLIESFLVAAAAFAASLGWRHNRAQAN